MNQNSNALVIRWAQREDMAAIMHLIKALAVYENLAEAVTGNAEALEQHLFGDSPYAEVVVGECQETVVGFALFFSNYSTFLTQPGIYLEDLFVLPDYRRQGIGRALLRSVAAIAHARGAGRLEWSVLAWNHSAIAFYEKMGADVLPDWRICRVSGSNLAKLADQASPSQ